MGGDLSPSESSISVSIQSNIDQLDGNVSLSSITTNPQNLMSNRQKFTQSLLPLVTVCNMRSLFPKIGNFKQDFLERSVDVSLLCEIWEQSESVIHKTEIEKMFELDGLRYFSSNRLNRGGGGVAIILNNRTFVGNQWEEVNLEVIWVLTKSKHVGMKPKNLI